VKRFGLVLALLILSIVSQTGIIAGVIDATEWQGQGFTLINNYTTLHFSNTADGVSHYAWVRVNGTSKAELDFMLDYADDGKQAFSVAFFKDDGSFVSVEYHDEGTPEWRIVTGSTTNFESDVHESVNILYSQNAGSFRDNWYHLTIIFEEINEAVFIKALVNGTEVISGRVDFAYTQISNVVIRTPGFADDFSSYAGGWWADLYVKNVDIEQSKVKVTFSLKDALTGQSLTGVTVKLDDGTILGTVDDGETLEFERRTYTLTFEKSGYWSVTKTIDVQGDMSVSVEMYPSSAAFMLENFPAEIKIPENTIYTLTFTLNPIQTSATYNTYLSISGLTPLEVRKDGSLVSPESGKILPRRHFKRYAGFYQVQGRRGRHSRLYPHPHLERRDNEQDLHDDKAGDLPSRAAPVLGSNAFRVAGGHKRAEDF